MSITELLTLTMAERTRWIQSFTNYYARQRAIEIVNALEEEHGR